jgi:hypothetical protein
MSKPSRRPTREARKVHAAQVKAARQALASQQGVAGVAVPKRPSVSNRLCPSRSPAEEQAAREEAVAAQLSAYRCVLPRLLKKLAKVPEPRQPQKVKHKLTVVLLYGLLMCVFQMASRRQANAEMSKPVFLSTLQQLFPELETLPHADTLKRVLERLEVEQLEAAHMELVQQLIRNKKFQRYLIEKRYPMAIDGTQKLARDGQWWGAEWLQRQRQSADGEWIQQYVYVLEANLVFHNGLTVPLLSEFLSYVDGDPDDHKQDCELKAFKRLAARLKRSFKRLPILLLLDGLYPNGPLMEQCRRYHWDYMIVLPSKSLPSVWEEVEGLRALQAQNHWTYTWRGRSQQFWWINDIEYRYDHATKPLSVHVVVCDERWQEVDRESGERVEKRTRHAWISSRPLGWATLHERCNLGARYRWGIEISMLVEKRQGYHYEHAFSYDWNAMKGFHYLMRLAHLLNAIAQYTQRVAKQVRTLGVAAFLTLVRETCAHPWLSPQWIQQLLATPVQLRLE